MQWHEKTDPLVVREIISLADHQLADSLAIAIAGDQRANTQANILAAISVALLVAATALLALKDHSALLISASVVSAAGFLVAAGVAMLAAKPVNYWPRGFQPEKLAPYANDADRLARWVAEDYQRRIEANRRCLERSALLTTRSQRIAIGSVVLPVAVVLFMQLPG